MTSGSAYMGYTVLLQEDRDGTTYSGETFRVFEEADLYAYQWAQEEWIGKNFKKIKNGFYACGKDYIAVEENT